MLIPPLYRARPKSRRGYRQRRPGSASKRCINSPITSQRMVALALLRVMASPAMTRTGTRQISALVAVAVGVMLYSLGAATPSAHASARWRACRDPYPAHRNPANPLMLPKAPGANPLSGAHFFVDGPAHGEAAHGIDRLLGIRPSRYKAGFSWARFQRSLDRGRLHRRLVGHPFLAWKVRML